VIFNYFILGRVEEERGGVMPRGWTSKKGVKGMRETAGKEINVRKLV
jgi:hypothetical protein